MIYRQTIEKAIHQSRRYPLTTPKPPPHSPFLLPLFIPSRGMPTTFLLRNRLAQRRFRITLQPLQFRFLTRILGICLRGGSPDVGVCRSTDLAARLRFWLGRLAAGFGCWVRRHLVVYFGVGLFEAGYGILLWARQGLVGRTLMREKEGRKGMLGTWLTYLNWSLLLSDTFGTSMFERAVDVREGTGEVG